MLCGLLFGKNRSPQSFNKKYWINRVKKFRIKSIVYLFYISLHEGLRQKGEVSSRKGVLRLCISG